MPKILVGGCPAMTGVATCHLNDGLPGDRLDGWRFFLDLGRVKRRQIGFRDLGHDAGAALGQHAAHHHDEEVAEAGFSPDCLVSDH